MTARLDPRDQRPQMKHGRLMPRLAEIVEQVNERLGLFDVRHYKAPEPKPEKPQRGKLIRVEPRAWSPFQAVVQRMTNHQRNQWAKAGYPGLRHEDTKPLRKFGATVTPIATKGKG